jgi:hypothetical protein
MADSGKQSPLGVNVLGSILNNTGLNINPVAASYMGASKTNDSYSFGSLVQGTVLRLLTWAINDGYVRGPGNSNTTLTDTTYNNLISIGAGTIPALGNSKPPTYVAEDPAGIWTITALAASGVSAPASSGWPFSGTIGQVQGASWIPYTTVNTNKSVTQWGWIRCHALQAWNEFNYNGTSVTLSTPEYKEFCSSFTTASAWINYSNQAIMAIKDSETFLQGIYSNMSDLITADIAGVSQSTRLFGEDLINLGKAINLSNIATFGLPSNLLRTLGLNSAITPDLSLALIAAGLSNSEISAITNGANVPITAQQEQQIYGAFLLIRGVNLVNVLAPLLCNTKGFESLADLLNVKKLFPNSYPTLTVPVYNDTLGLPTNSKTYYLIYTNGGINTALDTPAVREYVGIQIPAGTPPIFENTVSPNNYNELPTGFGAYLRNILPSDQAIAAGAFQYSMRQIRNIEYCDFERFAQVVKGMELTTDLPLTTGTNKPTNQESTTFSKTVCALGSGPFGTYTLSDMFGCMSGLPYPWAVLQGQISQLATQKLFNIYNQLFLAVTWEKAYCTITTTPTYVNVQQYVAPDPSAIPPVAGQPRIDNLFYTVTITQGDTGGGYGRGTAPTPTVALSPNNCGASVTTSIGTNDASASSNSGGTFGRVVFTINNGSSYNYGTATNNVDNSPPNQSSGPYAPPVESIAVQAPPTATLAVTAGGAIATGGTNTTGDTYYSSGSPLAGTAGWPSPMNDVVGSTTLGYIKQANDEITVIQNNNISTATQCNIVWNLIGSNLKREQRTRYTSLVPVPVPKDYFLNTYPMSLYTFVDSVPQLAQDTRPHMAAQTIEAITNTNTVGGQSAIAMMRQERNQTRLQSVGIQLDNNMSSELTPTELKTLLTNGTIPGAVEGILSPNGNEYTPPAWPGNDNPTRPGEVTLPDPGGIYVPPPGGIGGYPPPNAGGVPVDSTFPIDSTFPPNTGTGTPVPTSIVPFIEGDTGYLPGDGTKPGDLTPIYNGDPNPVVGPLVPVGPFLTRENPDIIIIGPPSDLNPNNLPPNLDPDYTGSTLFPSSPGIADAIEKVIECNCDCWIN